MNNLVSSREASRQQHARDMTRDIFAAYRKSGRHAVLGAEARVREDLAARERAARGS